MTVGAGEMNITLTDEDLTPDNDDGLPDNAIAFKSAIMQITKISAIDLHGGDLIGKQDPFIKLSMIISMAKAQTGRHKLLIRKRLDEPLFGILLTISLPLSLQTPCDSKDCVLWPWITTN